MPGGIFGFLMLITGIFDLTHQYFVSYFVTQTTVRGRCPFQAGVVIEKPFSADIHPESGWTAGQLTVAAQLISFDNGGQLGVCRKTPSFNSGTDVNFSVNNSAISPVDILGNWNCVDNGTQSFDQQYATALGLQQVVSNSTSDVRLYPVPNGTQLPSVSIASFVNNATSNKLTQFFTWTPSA